MKTIFLHLFNDRSVSQKVTVLDGVQIASRSVVTAGKYNDNYIYGGLPTKFLKNRKD